MSSITERLAALAESWDVPPKKHHSDYEQGFEDGQERCLEDLRALIASAPENGDMTKALDQALTRMMTCWLDLQQPTSDHDKILKRQNMEAAYQHAQIARATPEGGAKQGEPGLVYQRVAFSNSAPAHPPDGLREAFVELARVADICGRRDEATRVLNILSTYRPVPAHDGLREMILDAGELYGMLREALDLLPRDSMVVETGKALLKRVSDRHAALAAPRGNGEPEVKA
jgi:hypothetical protein